MIEGRSVLGLIAARGGSKGLPGKNIMVVDGRPLIQWTIDAGRQSRHIDRLILSSDDPAIMEVAKLCGCEVPFCRETSLATDEANSIDVVIDALVHVPGYDIVVLLQPTSPLRIAADIDGAIELLISSGAPACVSVCEAEVHPYWTFRFGEGDRLTRFAEPAGGMPLRRQDLPVAWSLNGALYVAECNWLITNRTFVSSDTVGFPMPVDRSLDIDTAEDFEKLKRVASRNKNARNR
ncbi:acylneuraminate cytidylyltransferase family protein [Bradyrhizobium centrosematis]|uniref:acylneuraminate cytidylyltransferase family protein n=1 Tax=Bradyrhizobium centrosematis TaxID=1300039 RepID=UPI00216923D0|nr:acylneuraminate cytidylyltransferase family protein [Bradyrhizobium centrosematis]MCS3765317.1 N-acylneuraminate cytidylyltransferase [Bradyrhizobium centrosematis]MCS3773983.1 N-acylneuraminate cytidylyltransferase [Bradyrhizobium centrosematis]